MLRLRRAMVVPSILVGVLILAGAGLIYRGCRRQLLGEELLAAAEAGDIARARSLIQQGAPLSSQGFAGRNALTLAACKGHTAIVQLMLDATAEPGAEERRAVVHHMSRGLQRTALECAAAGGHDAILTALLEEEARIGATPGRHFHRTPLEWAAMNGHLKTVRLLLSSGADVNEGISEGYDHTALMVAARWGHAQVVKELVEVGADLEASDADGTALIKATIGRASEDAGLAILETLLAGGANLEATDFHHRTALYHAAALSRRRLLRSLLEAGANPDGAPDAYAGESPLKAAAMRGDLESVQLLLTAGADPEGSTPGRTALMLAASAGHRDVLEALLDAGVEVNAKASSWPRTALACAAEAGQIECVRFLIEAGAKVGPDDLEELEVTGDPRVIRLLKAAQGGRGARPGWTAATGAAGRGPSSGPQELPELGHPGTVDDEADRTGQEQRHEQRPPRAVVEGQ